MPFLAAVQTTESGEPVLVCLSKRAFTKEFNKAAPAPLVSDDLGCFTVIRGTGILHEPQPTGGGAASAKHPIIALTLILHEHVSRGLEMPERRGLDARVMIMAGIVPDHVLRIGWRFREMPYCRSSRAGASNQLVSDRPPSTKKAAPVT